MTQRLHFLAGLMATLTITSFFSVSLFSELLGSKETIVAVKAWIVMPGLFLLIPAIAATGDHPDAGYRTAPTGRVRL